MSYDQNYPGPGHQGPYQQPQEPYQGAWQSPRYPPQKPSPQEPLYPPYTPQPQQIGTYVPVMYVSKVPGSGVGSLTLGIIALGMFIVGVSVPVVGGFFGFIGFVLAFIGAPLAIVTLVRRIRAKLPLGIPIAAVATNCFLVVLLFVAIIVTAAS